jgi:hypothetical protein
MIDSEQAIPVRLVADEGIAKELARISTDKTDERLCDALQAICGLITLVDLHEHLINECDVFQVLT